MSSNAGLEGHIIKPNNTASEHTGHNAEYLRALRAVPKASEKHMHLGNLEGITQHKRKARNRA